MNPAEITRVVLKRARLYAKGRVHGERGVVNCPMQAAGTQKKDPVDSTVNIEQLSSTLVSRIVLPK